MSHDTMCLGTACVPGAACVPGCVSSYWPAIRPRGDTSSTTWCSRGHYRQCCLSQTYPAVISFQFIIHANKLSLDCYVYDSLIWLILFRLLIIRFYFKRFQFSFKYDVLASVGVSMALRSHTANTCRISAGIFKYSINISHRYRLVTCYELIISIDLYL